MQLDIIILKLNSMQPATAKDLMFKSICFRLFLGLTVVVGSVSLILGIISTNVTCSHVSSCSSSFYYATSQCKTGGVSYCCGSYYDAAMPSYSCGGFDYCYKNPNPSVLCQGLVITARSFMGLALFFLLMVLVMMCHFRGVKRRMEKASYNQPLLFTSQQQFCRYQQAQNLQSINNQYSMNGPQPPASNQQPLYEQNRPNTQRIQVNLHRIKGEVIAQN